MFRHPIKEVVRGIFSTISLLLLLLKNKKTLGEKKVRTCLHTFEQQTR